MTKRGIVVTVSGIIAFVGVILIPLGYSCGYPIVFQFVAVAVIDTTWNRDRPYED